jgi:hypothetical protein
MNDLSLRWGGCAALACVLAVGCVPNHPKPPQTRPVAQAPDRFAALRRRAQRVTQLSGDYTLLSHELPGQSTAEHRQIMVAIFGKLDELLPLLAEPPHDLAFAERMEVIESSRSQLASSAPDFTASPAIDQGLRATCKILAAIVAGKDYDPTDLTAPLQEMSSRLDQLDSVPGPGHQVVVSQVVDASDRLISKLATQLSDRVAAATAAAASEPTTESTTEPTAAPTTAPATQPQ